MKTLYIKPESKFVVLENNCSLLSLSGVKSNGIDYGGVDYVGTLDPAAKKVNPFYKDEEEDFEEEE